jgi:hypothetical protein
MIQRHQRIVFWCLILCVIGMGVLLAIERQRGRDRIEALAADQTPLDAPTATTEAVTFDLANDDDGTVTVTTRQIALPEEANARARALIDHLIAEYALPGSPHPLPPGSAVAEVFLLPLPVVGYAADMSAAAANDSGSRGTLPVGSSNSTAYQAKQPGGELAVIDLRSTFVNQHPSGVEVETLTLRSILGTLHANVPLIEQVRFLVDGQARETLAGHADLLRTYPASDTASSTDGVRGTNEGQLN